MTSIQPLQPSDLKARLDAGESFRILDVRDAAEWDLGRLEGAEWMPLSRLPEWAPGIAEEGGPYVLYCHHGLHSMQACRALARRGVRGLHNLSGGIDAWSRQVDPAVPTY